MTRSGPTANWVVENGALKVMWSPCPSLTAPDPEVAAAGCKTARRAFRTG